MDTKESNNIARLQQRSKFITINKSSYKSLQHRAKVYYVRDKKLEGFYIRVYPSPSQKKVYGCQARLAGVGKLKPTIIGDCNLYSIDEARTKAKEYIQQLRDGILPKKNIKIEAEKNRTILDYLDIYIERKGFGMADSTIKEYRKQIHRDFASLNNVPITQLTKDDIANWYGANVRKKGRSTDHTFTIVKTLLKYAADDDYIEQNVAEKASNLISKYSPPQGIKKHIPITHLPDFLKAFLDASPFHVNGFIQKDIDKIKEDNLRLITETQRDYILFLLLTGLRKEEASSLKWSDVEMDEGRQIFAITITDNKANRPFRFPMTMTLRAMFEYRASLPSRHPVYIFPAKSSRRGSDRGYINDTRKAFLKIQKLAGFEETITPHDIRRTFSTLCNEMGLATAEVGKLLNHANASVTEGYIQRSLDNQRKLYDQYMDLIESNIKTFINNKDLEDGSKEEYRQHGIKNFFRNNFYGHDRELVEFNTEPPKPTYWDDYKT